MRHGAAWNSAARGNQPDPAQILAVAQPGPYQDGANWWSLMALLLCSHCCRGVDYRASWRSTISSITCRVIAYQPKDSSKLLEPGVIAHIPGACHGACWPHVDRLPERMFTLPPVSAVVCLPVGRRNPYSRLSSAACARNGA